MKPLRFLLSALLIASPLAASAADDDAAFGHVLTLISALTRVAASPVDAPRGVADLLAGKDAEANRAAAGLLGEMTADLPAEHREKVSAIGSNLLAAARKNALAAPSASASPSDALQARKDLTAMGLRYFDSSQFLDAVSRNDALAAELFVAGQGVNLSARDWRGRSALDIARANGNERLAALLSKSAP